MRHVYPVVKRPSHSTIIQGLIKIGEAGFWPRLLRIFDLLWFVPHPVVQGRD